MLRRHKSFTPVLVVPFPVGLVKLLFEAASADCSIALHTLLSVSLPVWYKRLRVLSRVTETNCCGSELSKERGEVTRVAINDKLPLIASVEF